MKKLKNLGLMKNANLWIDETVELQVTEREVLETEIIKDTWKKWEDASYVIELCIGQRHANNYALLGLKYINQEIDHLKIRVCIGPDDGPILEDTIATRGDEVHIGLPKEYGEKVLDISKLCLQETGCPQGMITFYVGAHGYVGSSQMIFGIATQILISLLENGDKNDMEKIEDITRRHLDNRE